MVLLKPPTSPEPASYPNTTCSPLTEGLLFCSWEQCLVEPCNLQQWGAGSCSSSPWFLWHVFQSKDMWKMSFCSGASTPPSFLHALLCKLWLCFYLLHTFTRCHLPSLLEQTWASVVWEPQFTAGTPNLEGLQNAACPQDWCDWVCIWV